MATILQQQLAAIAANSTHQLDLKAQKARHSKSLLFEPRDAANQSFDTLYQICIEGFQDLCALDSRFAPFARNLFSEQSKNEDRTLMTGQENADLDKVIEKFLGLLGGRLLLKPAMKAAEWLVRRFRVQEHNTEAVLFTFLPYHTSHVFPTLLSILPEQLPTSFRFLHPYVASLQCPPRHAILAAAVKNMTLFTGFSGYVLNVAWARHHSAILLRYWASITAQTVSGMIDATRSGRDVIRRQKEEDLLLKVLPILQNGLAIQGVSELYLGLCMVIVILTKASLSDKVIDALMEAVAGSWNEETLKEGITCLALLAEEKEEVTLPKSVTRAVVNQDGFLDIVDAIAEGIRVEKLLVGTALGAVRIVAKRQDSRAQELLLASLKSQDVADSYKLEVFSTVLKAIKDASDGGEDRQPLQAVLTSCAQEDAEARLISLAAKQTDVNLSQLDADLTLLLEPVQENEEEEADAMELDTPPSTERQSLDLEDLPKLPGKQASFLNPANDDLYDQYCTAFRRALPSALDLSALLDLPSLQKAACTKQPGVFSFFARAWTSASQNTVRLKALQITTELLQQIKQEGSAVDMQALVPYLVAGLADPVKSVRVAAASACVALNEICKSKDKSVDVWSKDSIYGKHSSQIQWLSSGDAQKLLSDAILPTLEDCVVDGNYIVNALTDVINGSSAASKHERKELRSSLRAATYSFLASHIVASPSQTLKLRLLAIVGKVGKVAGTHRVHILLPYVQEHVASSTATSAENLALTKALLGTVTHRSQEEIQFLKDVASGQIPANKSCPKLAFDRLRHIWKSLKDQAQTDLVDWLLDLSLSEDVSDDVQSDALEVLKNLSLPTNVLVHLVESLPTVSQLQGLPSPAKKQRTSRGSDATKLVHVDKPKLNKTIRRVTLVLELVEESKPEQHPQLLKSLFHFLSELHHYKTLMDSELVYLQGLLINSLLSVVNGLKGVSAKDVDRSTIRADLIVDCVRTTSSTQVHHAALLLMSALASWAPDLVLHSVMPLFTFMSSTILKQGDDYSAHVTDQTVARIIPPLAASLKKRGKDLISGAAELLLSFTAAFEHIPLHRRSGLFQHLVKTLGAEESLFAITAMLVERYPEDAGVGPFVSSLMGEFPVSVQLHAVNQYLDLVFDTRKTKRGLSDAILGFGEKNKEQATASTAALIEGLANVLLHQTLRKKLAKELKQGGQTADELRTTYSKLLEKTMQLDLQLKTDATLHQHASNLLTSLLALMPTSDFIDSSAKLMQTGNDEIRQQVFVSLEQRVKTAKRGDAELQQIFMDVLPNCAVFVTKSQPVEVRLAAIACVDRIAEKFGKTQPDLVLEAAQTIAGPDALASSEPKLRHMSILCLASMVEVLGDQFAGVLQVSLKHTLTYLEANIDQDDVDEELTTAAFSLAMAVLDYIPWMLAGNHLSKYLVCAAKAEEFKSARQFATLAAKKVAPETLLGVIDQTWEETLDEGVDGIQLIVDTLHQVVQHHTKAVVTKNARTLFDVLFKTFDLRRRLVPTIDEDEDSAALFDLVNTTTMDAVLKLNDATFRPFFLQLAERSFAGSSKEREGMVLKCTSLFSFTFVLFEQLKSLVTSYAAFLLDNTAKLLESLSPQKHHEKNLLDLILQTLATSFTNDQDAFWQSPSHFDAIVTPLLNLTKATYSPDEHLIPAITEFAATANSPDHHKAINSALMTFMRHEDGMVRYAAVKTQRHLTEKLEIEWCNFLPEWVPVMSELQEDDEVNVEREVGRWMKEVGRVTGEEIEDMMR